jgi:hypothetical protein
VTHPNTIETLSPRDRMRLAGILARLSSPFENERAIAGLLASAFIATRGLNWTDLTRLLEPIRTFQPPPAADRRRNGRSVWQGYCRRRPTAPGQALSRLV